MELPEGKRSALPTGQAVGRKLRRRNSSVVERHLGKMEVESPILSSGSRWKKIEKPNKLWSFPAPRLGNTKSIFVLRSLYVAGRISLVAALAPSFAQIAFELRTGKQ